MASSLSGTESPGYPSGKTRKPDSCLYHTPRLIPRGVVGLNVKNESIKLVEENVENILITLGLGEKF